MRQTVRLAGIGVTYLSTEEPQAQIDLVKLLERLLEQVIEMRVEKEANVPANRMRSGIVALMDIPEGELLQVILRKNQALASMLLL